MKIRVPHEARKRWKNCDEQAQRVYAACQYSGATHWAYFKDMEEVLKFIKVVIKGKTWARYGKHIKTVNIYPRGRGLKYAYGGRSVKHGYYIALPDNRFGRSIDAILHELAHVLTVGDDHGSWWIHVHLMLVKEFFGTTPAIMLEEAYYSTGALKHGRKK